MAGKTERITFLATQDFKEFLNAEANSSGISVSEFIRIRCEQDPANNNDEAVLSMLVEQVREATVRARQALTNGLHDAERVLSELRQANKAA